MNAPTPTPATHAGEDALTREQEDRLRRVWATPPGWRYWSAVNNAVVGKWYITASFAFFMFGGMLALLMRTQLAVPDNDVVSADFYNQLFTLHGSVMMFLFAVPILEAFSILILPEMLGTRDLPFPRLSAYGFWCFVVGGVFVCGSIFFNAAPKGGWFMYPPLTTEAQPGVGADIWLLGLSFIEIASIAAAVELLVGILRCRSPGMRLNLIPLYTWYMMVVAGMILFAFPPLIIGDVLLELERAFGWPFFDAARGGDPLLWQHLFWVFGHPEVYIVFLPSIALVAMIVPTFAQRPVVGYSWIVLAAVGTGFLSFGLWVHHMYTTGLPGITLGFFSAASVAVAIPTGVQILCFIATMLAARVTRSIPLLYAMGGLVIFIMGGLSGVMVALAPFDFQAHDTYFIVAHLHYVLVGGVVFPILAGAHYYFPFATGKLLSARLGRIAFWLLFIGFNVAFLPMHLTGLRGMPRRVFTYAQGIGFDGLNLVSTIGASVLAAGFLVFVFDLLRPRSRQPFAPRNPWNAGTLEWLCRMPGEAWGVRSIPEIDGRYPLWDQPNLMNDVDAGRFYLPDAEEGKRETLVTTTIDAEPLQCLRVPGNSFLPMAAAVATGGLFILATFHWWWPAAASGAVALATILIWLWTGTGVIPEKPEKDVGLGSTLPLYMSGRPSVGWWAMFITMTADLVATAALIGGYAFYWLAGDDFPLSDATGPGLRWPLIALALVLGAWSLTVLARRWNRAGRSIAFLGSLLAAVATAGGGAIALIAGPWQNEMDPTTHAYPAMVWLLVIWLALHVAIGIIMLLYCIARTFARRITPRYDIDMANVTLYWHFVAITAVAAVAVVTAFPLVL